MNLLNCIYSIYIYGVFIRVGLSLFVCLATQMALDPIHFLLIESKHIERV